MSSRSDKRVFLIATAAGPHEIDSGAAKNAKDVLEHAIKWYGYDNVLQAMQQIIEEHQGAAQRKD